MHSLAGHLIVSLFRRKASGKWQMETPLGMAAIEKRKKNKETAQNLSTVQKDICINIQTASRIRNKPEEDGYAGANDT